MRNPRLIRASVVAASIVEKPRNPRLSFEEVRPGVDLPASQEAEVALHTSPCHLVSAAGLLRIRLAGQALIIHIEEHPQKEERKAMDLKGGNIRGQRM